MQFAIPLPMFFDSSSLEGDLAIVFATRLLFHGRTSASPLTHFAPHHPLYMTWMRHWCVLAHGFWALNLMANVLYRSELHHNA